MKLSVCIGTVRPATLGAAIASIRAQSISDWELIIVGQGREAGLREVGMKAEASDSRIRYIHLDAKGLSRARNAGIAAAAGDIVAFTDDDCEAAPAWLETVRSCFEDHPNIGLVGGAVVAPSVRHRMMAMCPMLMPAEAVYDPSKRPPPPGWDFMGANFAVRRELLNQIGPFDECLGVGTEFPAGEDTDYKLRLEQAGVLMLSTPRAIVHHTFGVRYGLAARLNQSRNYAMGNGALAGKLTLMGDLRGEEWIEATRRDWFDALRSRRVKHLASHALRWRYYMNGYRRCLADYKIVGCTLQMREPGAVAAS